MREIIEILLNSLGGISFVLVGLFGYLGKLRLEKYKNDLDETQTKLRGLIDSTVHVSKAQFDKEFGIYQDSWKLVAELKSATLALRDSFGEVVAKIKGEEFDASVSQEQIERYLNAIHSLSQCLNQNKPFYSIEVHDSLNSIVGNCTSHFYLAQKELDEGFRKDFIENQKHLIAEVNSCCELIRSRIYSFSAQA